MKIERKRLKISGLVLIIISTGLLIRELIQYDKLPGMDDPISQVADFFKYKENAVTNGIIWTGLIILGLIIYLKNRRK
ncbi:hypothetical protein BZG02_05995 [Labilibaculum filiforme]|uniref:Uncharacterized protein n=1 Tax=Labilibaculum filiforme TaxID=1940526 RepID=A0A2N3I226_9BACT|nr:hypothetical protein [Labilibaculum filiforme]PKQ64368.1 hypothetical protein BZG02_05995 [Labilibaculum filiforme]